MDTKQRRRRTSPGETPRKRRSPAKAANNTRPRRKTGPPDTPDRAERHKRIQQRRKHKTLNPPTNRRVIRAPREEIPAVVYTAPKPLSRGGFALRLATMAAAAVAVFLALSVFFRVETITVAGADKYTPWMVRQAAGVEPGEALLSVGEARVASRIIDKLPYVDRVKVDIRLPGTVEIQITELQVTYSIEDENGAWWLISSGGRAVEQVNLDKALGYTRVEGVAIRTPEQGQQVQAVPGQIIDPGDGTAESQDQADADEQLASLIAVLTALEKNRIIGAVTVVEVGYLAAALEQLEDSQSGELDLTLEYTEDAVFTPER